ncbi:MAG TPA: hypothetical protein VJ508_07570, partial [Saprospiraceae bacterium]|nr:hypothetical protein [Saprospiraceae bacterium]
QPSIESRTDAAMDIVYDNIWITPGITVEISLISHDGMDLAGLQFDIHAESAQITGIKGSALDITGDNFNVTDDGGMIVSWNAARPRRINQNEVLFSIKLKSDRGGWARDILQFNQHRIRPEGYTGDDLEVRPLVFDSSPVYSNAGSVAFQVIPNPVTDQARVVFNLQEDETVGLSFYDSTGKLVWKTTVEGERGENEFQFSKASLALKSGVVICQGSMKNRVALSRFVIMD